MTDLNYNISDITPLSGTGELEVTMENSRPLQEMACSAIGRDISLEDIEEVHYNASFHPASQDVRLQVIWTDLKSHSTSRRVISMATSQQATIIAAISRVCKEEFGLSPQELLENARKEDERRMLRSFTF